MTQAKATKIANTLTQKFGTCNPYDICIQLDIDVLFVPLVDIRGFCHNVLGNHFIYIADNLPKPIQKFVCAHELAHILLHYSDNGLFLANSTHFLPTKLEREADLVANILIENTNN